jgi:hypothetical protein
MNDTFYIIIVLFTLIGGLILAAYFLEKRGKIDKPNNQNLPELGRVGKILLWIIRILVITMALSLVGGFVFKSLPLFWVTASCLLLYVIVGIIFRIIRLAGKKT